MVTLQVALNGDRTKNDHTSIPVSIEELASDAAECVAAGAQLVHLHPRDGDGRESLEPSVVDQVVGRVRDACGVPIGVTTGQWIEPDLERRLRLVSGWRGPDFTSVNVSEPGSFELMRMLIRIGVGIEAGVWSPDDAERLGASGLGRQVTRILVEPGMLQVGSSGEAELEMVDDIHRILDRFGLRVPRLQHGDGDVTWPLLEDAIRRGVDTRVGFEDTIYGPSGELAGGNAALVRAARKLGAGTARGTD